MSRTTFGYDQADRPITVEGADSHVTTTVYDAAGRVVARPGKNAFC